MNIEEEIIKNQSILILIAKSEYPSKHMEIVKLLDKNFRKIGYVYLKKSYKTLKKKLTKNKVDFNKFLIIGLDKPTKEQLKAEYYSYIASPADFGGINIALSDLAYRGCKSFLFDSLSNMIAYVKDDKLLKFINTIIIKTKVANTNVIFLALSENINAKMLNDLNMIFDKIIVTPTDNK
ncbi:hypothetical protein IH879_19385 [candidate division KSB1 bacterium]|nr:hypothetical protein [candidate division KSB1 bacterium]